METLLPTLVVLAAALAQPGLLEPSSFLPHEVAEPQPTDVVPWLDPASKNPPCDPDRCY